MTDTFMAAQLFVFFLAGFETSSSTMSNALYELALNPKIQETLRQEIHSEMERTGGTVEYDGIKNMKYLHKVFNGNRIMLNSFPFCRSLFIIYRLRSFLNS